MIMSDCRTNPVQWCVHQSVEVKLEWLLTLNSRGRKWSIVDLKLFVVTAILLEIQKVIKHDNYHLFPVQILAFNDSLSLLKYTAITKNPEPLWL